MDCHHPTNVISLFIDKYIIPTQSCAARLHITHHGISGESECQFADLIYQVTIGDIIELASKAGFLLMKSVDIGFRPAHLPGVFGKHCLK